MLTLEVTTGHETDAFSSDPAVTRVSITTFDAGGAEVASASTTPGGAFAMGELPIDQLVRFEVRGTDANGDTQIRGRSLGFVLGALESTVFPIFAQRVASSASPWSRPPGELPHSNVDGHAVVLGERYLVLTGGTAIGGDPTTLLFYDMLALGGVAGGTLTSTPKTMTTSADGSTLILIDDDSLRWINFDSAEEGSTEPPEGLGEYSSVAGGQAVRSPDAIFIVGATRAAEPSDRVLIIRNTGVVESAQLNTPRLQAAASWVDGIGLVVVGGADEGAGVEIIADGSNEADDLPFATDPTAGAVAALGPAGEQLLLVCGDNGGTPVPSRILDLDCGASCEPVTLTATMGPLTDCSAFKSEDEVIVAGHNQDGVLESYALRPIDDTITPLPLREERMGARVLAAPNGTLAVIGGAHPDGTAATTVELLFPNE